MTGLQPTSNGLLAHASRTIDPLGTLVKAWLAGYKSERTRQSYTLSIRQWFAWCAKHDVDVLAPLRAHIELYQRDLEQRGRKPRTVYARLVGIASFYDYLIDEDVIQRDPMRGVRRPVIERRSPTGWLTRSQCADFLTTAVDLGPCAQGVLMLMMLNGLRIGEVCSLNVGSLAWDGYYPFITFTRKGSKQGRAILERPAEAAVVAAIDGRHPDEPMFLNAYGNRLTRINAQRFVDKAMKGVRGTHGRITNHALRHSWATACVDAHVPVDQIQHDGGWSDPRLITYYSHGRDAPARASTHAVTAFIYGAA